MSILDDVNQQAREKPTKEEVEAFLGKWGIKNFTIRDNGMVDVHEDVELDGWEGKTYPFKFGKIDGCFLSPDVGLETLENGPEEVDENFFVFFNKLSSLVGMPKRIGGACCIDKNPFSSLEGITPDIGGDLSIQKCPNLHSLHGIRVVKKFAYDETASGEITTTETPINDSVLGLFRVGTGSNKGGLKKVDMMNKDLEKILNQFLVEGEREPLMCQEALIAAGFVNEAKM